MTETSINDITASITEGFEGYIWVENKTAPYIIESNSEIDWDSITKGSLFIAEALLYSKEEEEEEEEEGEKGTAIWITYIDGRYYIKKTELANISINKNDTIITPLAKSEDKLLQLLPIFEDHTDPFATDFEEARSSHYIFLGFAEASTNNQ